MSKTLDTRWAIAVVAIIGFALLLWWLETLEPQPRVLSEMREVEGLPDKERASEKYTEWLKEVGPSKASELFSQSMKEIPIRSQHDYAHLFGGALYTAEGIEGISYCDTQFSYGCFHEFIGSAIVEHGVEAAPLLNEQCIKSLGIANAGFCQHGVGHGLQTFYGYTVENLDEALSLCAELPNNDIVGGCAGGIFMEYNMRTMIEADVIERRPIAGNPYEPCQSLTGDALEACVYWQPQWWHEVQFDGSDKKEFFTIMGAQCRGMLTDTRPLSRCFEGIGNVIPSLRHLKLSEARALCESAGKEHSLLVQACVTTARDRVLENEKNYSDS